MIFISSPAPWDEQSIAPASRSIVAVAQPLHKAESDGQTDAPLGHHTSGFLILTPASV